MKIKSLDNQTETIGDLSSPRFVLDYLGRINFEFIYVSTEGMKKISIDEIDFKFITDMPNELLKRLSSRIN